MHRDRKTDIDQWTRALLRLPDESFFDTMRNYLGELRTPFNKHRLIEELSSFLRRKETQERLLRHMDEADSRVLTAVQLLDHPTMNDLFHFFEGSMSYLELHYLVVNLRERLLVFLDEMSGGTRILFNPFLERILIRRVVNTDRLFPSRRIKLEEAEIPWPTEALLLALFSYFSAAPDLLKSDGKMKKRALEEIGVVFPRLVKPELSPGSAAEGDIVPIGHVLPALLRLGLVRNEKGVILPNQREWRSFSDSDGATRLSFFWAALVRSIEGADDERQKWARRSSDRSLAGEARMIAGLFANLPPDRSLSMSALRRLLALFAPAEQSEPQESFTADFIHALARIGLLLSVRSTGDSDEWYAVNPHVSFEQDAERRLVILEPNFQLTLKPSVPFNDGLTVAAMSEIRRFDVYPRYEVTKRSFGRALEHGLSSVKIIEILERLGETPLPQNIRFSFVSWEKEYRGIALFQGVVLTADVERRHLIEHSEAMRPWILKTLSPGVYLLGANRVVEWSRALKQAGIDSLPSIRQLSTGGPNTEGASLFPSVGRPRRVVTPSDDDQTLENRDSTELTNRLLDKLKRMDLPAELQSELAARIRKKLILYPEQLEQAQPRVERNEAKGLDYVGKVRLVEQALGSGSDLLEIIERTSNGSTRRLLVRPIEVRKSGNDLILRATTLPKNEAVQIRVRKIGLVRKLRSSLYAP